MNFLIEIDFLLSKPGFMTLGILFLKNIADLIGHYIFFYFNIFSKNSIFENVGKRINFTLKPFNNLCSKLNSALFDIKFLFIKCVIKI